jgi:uncharacterized protein YjbJ (UPF0337 family)
MNWSEIQTGWEQLSPMLKAWWPQLNDHDLQQIAGSREQLAAVLGERYGFQEDDAERRICAFEKELRLPGAVR